MPMTRHHAAQLDLFFLEALPSGGSAPACPDADAAWQRWRVTDGKCRKPRRPRAPPCRCPRCRGGSDLQSFGPGHRGCSFA